MRPRSSASWPGSAGRWRAANARSEQVALVDHRPGQPRGDAPASGISIGVGGGSGGYHGGGAAGGVSADIPVGGNVHQIVMTELAVRIQRRSDAHRRLGRPRRRWRPAPTPSWRSPGRGRGPARARPCFRTSPESRAALSGFDDLLRYVAPFDGGNIRLVAIDGDRLDLEIVKDHQSDFYQWFYFRLTGGGGRALELRILNCAGAAYPHGWDDYRACMSDDREEWERVDTDYDGRRADDHG